jgi:hypothetical protein
MTRALSPSMKILQGVGRATLDECVIHLGESNLGTSDAQELQDGARRVSAARE